ncbi:MAG: RNA-binding ATPase activator esf2 [Phylliscum demangeonii]|nr:MAG: RNA-binding ATPase activator esf2 [Phylliscum demangeonii]
MVQPPMHSLPRPPKPTPEQKANAELKAEAEADPEHKDEQDMAPTPRNQWLDAGELSEDQDHEPGYDSEAGEKRKGGSVRGGKGVRAGTRRRVVRPSADEADVVEAARASASGSSVDPCKGGARPSSARDDECQDEEKEAGDEEEDEEDEKEAMPSASKPKPAAPVPRRRRHKTGVIYLSRIPPFMKPSKLRHLLSRHGALNRIYLTPEDGAAHRARVRAGGNKKTAYRDGWVEFESKRAAKRAAETLNTRIVGGKKGGFYHDDVWNVKYLSAFKWRHLTEQIAHENAERAARLRAEITRTRKEDRAFVSNVERAKRWDGMLAKRAAKRARDGDGDGDPGPADAERDEPDHRPLRVFRQHEVIAAPVVDLGGPEPAPEQSDTWSRVLRNIF